MSPSAFAAPGPDAKAEKLSDYRVKGGSNLPTLFGDKAVQKQIPARLRPFSGVS